MHAIQRQLLGLAVYDPNEVCRVTRSSFVSVGDTGLWVPVHGKNLPASRQRVGWEDHRTDLVLADLEAPEILDLLREQGLGRIAAVTWRHRGYYAGGTAHAPTGAEAVAALGTFLESSWPRAAVLAECAGQRDGDWPFGERRTTTGGVVVAPPTSRDHSKAMVRWSHRDGELHGEAFANGGPHWRLGMFWMLEAVPQGIGKVVRDAYDRAGRPDGLAVKVSFRDRHGELAVEDPAGRRLSATGATPSA